MKRQERGRADHTTGQNAVRRNSLWAEHGDVSDYFNLGYMYDIGWTVPQDYAEALKWYRKAADHGYPQAQYKLGVMYYKGQGVTRNIAEAYVWFSIALASGFKGAIKKLDKAATRLSPEEQKSAQERATCLFEETRQRKE